MPQTKLLFVIPARGGSKGLPGKNLAPVGGIPLVGRAARLARRVAQAIGPACRVVCSTDDAAIAEAAREWGAEIPFMRPAELASDSARTSDVVLHALEAIDGPVDKVVLLQPTSPFTEVEDVLGAVRLHCECAAAVISVCPAEHPAEWLFTLDDAARLRRLLESGKSVHQRQQTIAAFRPNGAVYVSDGASFRIHQTFLTPETRGFVMPAARSIDIDTKADLDIARAVIGSRETRPVRILDRRIGSGSPCFVIAEADVDHNGDVDLARRIIDAAAASGADAVNVLNFGERKPLEFSAGVLADHCEARGIAFLSTPFDESSADLLSSFRTTAFKLPSGEVSDHDLFRHVARKGKPIILSTGRNSLARVAGTVDVLQESGCESLALLQRASDSPAESTDVNLRSLRTMEMALGWPVGCSNQTQRKEYAIAAVAMGARLLETRFTLDRTVAGSVRTGAMEPAELASLIREIRKVEAALGATEDFQS
jgi:N,N'-diacetyllegionaminate synthase